ncbi:MAG: metallophosphoesterase family protein [Candidatus Methanoplasma sp.]|jgi:Icc-related predicted phosphoesterase|nr:metallophosphoesterase family protein [Candidatus Methanoplasma sp.]
MKFLVITDLHQNIRALTWINDTVKKERPDHILFLGDITDFGTGEDAAKILDSIEGDKYAIPGNTDPRDLPEKISKVAHSVHGKAFRLGDYDAAALGGSNITIFNTPFELTEDEIDSALRPISKKGMILITHAPSYGILDHIPSGLSVGSPAVKKIVEDFRPILALSGHIHEDRGVLSIDGTVFVNPGPAKEGYSAIIRIENGKVDVRLLGPL